MGGAGTKLGSCLPAETQEAWFYLVNSQTSTQNFIYIKGTTETRAILETRIELKVQEEGVVLKP